MGLVTRAFRNLARNKVRMLLVVLALSISIASTFSVYTGIDASNENTQKMIDKANSDTAAMIANATSNTQTLIGNASYNTQAVIDSANASTQGLINNATKTTQAMIDDVNASTQAMINQVLAETNETIELTEKYINATQNETQVQMTRIDVTNATSGRPPKNMPILGNAIENISAMTNVSAVIPVVQNNTRMGSGSFDPGSSTGGGGPGGQPGGQQNGTQPQRFKTPDYVIEGLPLDAELNATYHLLPVEIVAGDSLAPGDNGTVLLTEDLLKYFKTEVGGVICLNGTNMTVKGVYFNPYSNNTIVMNITDARAILGLGANEASMLMVYATNTSTVNNVTEQILSAYTTFTAQAYMDTQAGTSQFTQRMAEQQIQRLKTDRNQQVASLEKSQTAQIAQLETRLNEQVTTFEDNLADQIEKLEKDRDEQVQRYNETLDDQVQRYNTTLNDQVSQRQRDKVLMTTIGSIIILVSMVSACLIIFFMMLYTVKERTKEIGLFKALGFSSGNVVGQITVEGTFIGFLGGLFGLVIGVLAGPTMSRLVFPSAATFGLSVFSPALCLEIIGATVLLGALGSLYPAWNAARMKPMVAMKND